MKKYLIASLMLAFACGGTVAVAEDAVCLDCHDASEYEGMTAEELTAAARDPENEDHADNAELSDEELAEIVSGLLGAE